MAASWRSTQPGFFRDLAEDARPRLARREPFLKPASDAYLRAAGECGKPFLSAHAYATLFYLLGAVATRKKRQAEFVSMPQ